MVIIIGNEISNPSSNPGQSFACHFVSIPLGNVCIHLFSPPQLCINKEVF